LFVVILFGVGFVMIDEFDLSQAVTPNAKQQTVF
jgi:hypothetical protein